MKEGVSVDRGLMVILILAMIVNAAMLYRADGHALEANRLALRGVQKLDGRDALFNQLRAEHVATHKLIVERCK